MRRKPPLINKTAATGSLVSDIDDLGDVVITSAANGDLLQFDGSNWVNVTEVSDGNVPASAVTQHQAALSITESQISDLSHTTDHGALTGLADNDHPQYARSASNETITGQWTFDFSANDNNRIYGATTNAKNFAILFGSSYDGALVPYIRGYGIDSVADGGLLYINVPGGGGGVTFASTGVGAPLTITSSITQVDINTDVDISGALSAASYGGITEANLLDKTDDETVSGNWLFSAFPSGGSGVEFTSVLPGFWMQETDAAADEQVWRQIVNGKTFSIDVLNDAKTTVASALRVIRGTGNTVDEIELNATNLDFNGAADFSTNIEVRGSESSGFERGINGRYSDTSPSTNWGQAIWSIDTTWDGSGTGSSYETSSHYGISWLRSGHTDALSSIGEGLYLYNNGNLQVALGTQGILTDGVVLASSGGVSLPSYTFSSDTDTGMYLAATNDLRLVAGGTTVMRVQTSAALFDKDIFIKEQAAAGGDIPSWGQLWVLNESPNELWFTDDAGNDHHVAGGQLTENFGVSKPDNEFVTNSSTLQDDDDLVLNVKSGFTYLFTCELIVYSNSTTPDFKLFFETPASSTGHYQLQAHDGGEGDPSFTLTRAAFGDTHFSIPVNGGGEGAPTHVYVRGSITAGADGVLQVQWAQNTATSGISTTVRAGSLLTIQRV